MLDRLSTLRDRPYTVAALVAVAAQLLFAAWIDRPHQILFDEVHYVPAAQALLALDAPRNTEHPLVAKELIALGMMIFGDNPWGWRLIPSLAGAGTVVGCFAFLWLLTRDMRTAVTGAVLAMLNQLVFVLARTAMLDVFLGLFLVWALVALLWAARGSERQVRRRWVLGSVLLGLAVGVKWAAIPYVALAGMAFLVLRVRDHWPSPVGLVLGGKNQPHWPGLATVPALLILGAVSIATYLLTFLPAFFYAQDPLTLAKLIPFQLDMYAAQTQVLRPHGYQSDWWSWPLMVRPIWYFYEWDAGAWRGVLLIGNPAIMWGGLVAVGACLVAWWRGRDIRPLAAALLWIASVVIYIVIPKSLGFYYYYYLSGIFLCFAIPLAFRHWRARTRTAETAFVAVSVAMFAYFYPILAAMPLIDGGGFNYWMWFDSWR